MPATMTRGNLRAEIRDLLGEPQGEEKTWTDVRINTHIQSALNSLAAFCVINGFIETEVDETGDTFAIPAEIIQLRLVQIGDTDYQLAHPADQNYLAGNTRPFAYSDATEEKIVMPEELEVGDTIRWLGVMWAEQLDAEDTADDDTVLSVDDRYKDLLVYDSARRCLSSTEDNYARFKEYYDEQVARFGLSAMVGKRIQYYRPLKHIWEGARY